MSDYNIIERILHSVVLKTNMFNDTLLDLEKFFNKKVFLKTWVKTKKNWNNDSDFISSLGIGSLYD